MIRVRNLVFVSILLAFVLFGTVAAACDAALLVIDVQEHSLSWGVWSTSTGETLLDAVVRVLPLARSAGIPVIYVQGFSILDFEEVDEAELGFPAAVAPREGNGVFPKYSADAFTTLEFAAYMEDQRLRRLLLCGLASTGCVSSTLFSAIDKGYEVAAIADAHSNGPPNPMTGAASWPAANVNAYLDPSGSHGPANSRDRLGSVRLPARRRSEPVAQATRALWSRARPRGRALSGEERIRFECLFPQAVPLPSGLLDRPGGRRDWTDERLVRRIRTGGIRWSTRRHSPSRRWPSRSWLPRGCLRGARGEKLPARARRGRELGRLHGPREP